jgi:tripartite ATP-independent transporter DctP family solute receptor
MLRRFLRIFFFFSILNSFLIFGCSKGDKVKILKLAHVLDTGHPVHKGMAYLADKAYEYSKGKMRVDIYPGGQLGSEREYIESLQIGSLDLTKVSTAVLENFVPSMAVFSLPYVFRDEDHRWDVYNGVVGKKMLLDGEPFWLRGLCFFETGSRNFYLRDKAVYSPKDLQGLKIRVMRSYWSIQTINALGGSATPIAFGELYTALQQGVVDAAENNIPTLFQSRHYETCKYVVLDEHSSPSDVLLISTHSWDRLANQQKKWLQMAVADAVTFQRSLWGEATRNALDEMERTGVTIIKPDKSLFRKQVQPLFMTMKENKDPLYDLVLQIQSVGADTLK